MPSGRKILYADCFSGISGNMFLAAMLDAGLPLDHLKSNLDLLDIGDYNLKLTSIPISSIRSVYLETQFPDQPQRSWQKIKEIIENSQLSIAIKSKAISIFQNLAEAEARIHGCNIADVHFHEIGGLDSIIDIIGAAIALEYFNLDRFYCSNIPMPQGWVICQHGKLPLPAPAVCEILKDVPVYGVNISQELVTPTGAAIIKISDNFGMQPAMKINKIGYGAGSHELDNGQPNILRVLIGDLATLPEDQEVVVISCNLDDWQTEGFPYISERLFAAKALDVTLIPVQMKKGRPGFILQVISSEIDAPTIKDIILSETSAIGLRFHKEERLTLPRQSGTIKTSLGSIQVKKIDTPAGIRLTPEYEDCRRVAIKFKMPLSDIYREVARQPIEMFEEEK